MSVTDRTIRTPQADLRLSQSSGSGMPIVMIHGSGASRAVFARQFDSPLADAHRLIAFDLPGHGDSSDARDPAAAYTITGLAQTTARLLDVARGVLRVVVLAQVGDDDVGALAGEGDCHGPADPAVAAGDDRPLSGQPAGALVALLAVVRPRGHLAQRAGRGLLLSGLGVGAR